MNRVHIVALATLVGSLVGASVASADGYFFASSAGKGKDLEVFSDNGFGRARAESRAGVAGRHRGLTFLRSRGNSTPMQMGTDIRCGSTWYWGPVTVVGANAMQDVTNECSLELPNAQCWQAQITLP
jgi:hypothetical protein